MSASGPEVDFLRGVPILAGLPDDLIEQLVARSTTMHVDAGTWLFREGEPGDAAYVVQSGRLEVVSEGSGEVIRILTRADVAGELALLTGSERSASVRARRDSELLVLSRTAFVDLLQAPEFALGLTRVLGSQLQASRGVAPTSSPVPATVALVELERGANRPGLVSALQRELERHSLVTRLDPPADGAPPDSYGPMLDGAERASEQVVLVAERAGGNDAWTDFCLRQADRVVGLSRGGRVPSGVENLHGCDLLLTRPVADLTEWLDALDPRAVYHVHDDRGAGAAARRLAGRSIGVVLSGGGARGLAHIGVMEGLLDAGVTIDRIGSCSMGALVGSQVAMGRDADEVAARLVAELVEANPMNDYTLPLYSLVHGRKAERMVRHLFGETMIESLPRDFFAVSADLVSGKLTVHRRGPLYVAVGASFCLPGIGAPVATEGRLLVDGGVLNNLPVDVMAATGEGPTIAVDVTARFRPPPPRARFGRPLADRIAAEARKLVVRGDDPVPRLQETLVRTLVLGSIDTADAAQRYADVVIEPEVEGFGLLAFDRIDEIRAAGREAAHRALEEHAELLLAASPAPAAAAVRS